MLSPKAQCSLADAKRYFGEHLAVGEYYMQGQQVRGQWYGKGAADLGLSGVANVEQFERLCDNLHPQTGQRLTMRQKTTRSNVDADGAEHERANRRVFYDFTISPPKSVSIAALVGNDRRIVEAHERAVTMALEQLQAFASTRVRKDGQSTDRTTGNIVAATFRHDTSRALDPHLHTHCIVFNATYDSVECRWKALQNHDMLVAQKFIENVYYHELARSLQEFGYEVGSRNFGDFQIKGISKELRDLFSKRHRQIDEKTRELLACQPEKADRNIAAIREHIAHKERDRKMPEIGLSRLQAHWDGQMTSEQLKSLRNLIHAQPTSREDAKMVAGRAVAWAEEHLFDRRSVVNDHELWRHALGYATGQNVTLKDIQTVTGKRDYIRDEKHPGKVTTREHLQREWEIVEMVHKGLRRHHSFRSDYRCANPSLDAEQRLAVERILVCSGFVAVFRGGAGTGKSYTLREVEKALKETGRAVRVIAPQRQQVMDLEKDGFQNVETVCAFLAQGHLEAHSVIIVDEAGQIGGKQMHTLLEFALANESRVILSGDTRQHGAVEAADALRAIEKYSGVRPIELTTIRRQNPELAKTIEEREWIKQYRQAVAEAHDGKFAESFNRLDRQGAIIQCGLADQHQKLAEHYLALAKDFHSTVVVSQSWNEIHQVNEQIRQALKGEKLVGETDKILTTFQPVDMTGAQKRDQRSYDENSVLVFNRNVRGCKAGEAARLQAITETNVVVENEGRRVSIPFKHLDRITVCQTKKLALASGDRLLLKANGRSEDDRKLANGELVTINEIHEDGRIALADGRVLSPHFRQFVRGYAVTSYASQGKSVDHVLFSDSAVKAATNQRQWYVTISRGRKGVQIFTADKIQLRQNVLRSGDRELALDIAKESSVHALAKAWGRDIGYVLNVQHSQRQTAQRRAELLQRAEVQEKSESVQQSQTVRTARKINPAYKHNQKYGGGIGV
jgi:conjugative relaxase-like TrwC/TraI family protein